MLAVLFVMHNNLNYKDNIIGQTQVAIRRWNLRNTLNHFKISILFGLLEDKKPVLGVLLTSHGAGSIEFHFASWLLHRRNENNFSKMASQMSFRLYG